MSSKNEILNNVKRHIGKKYDMPDLDIHASEYPDKIVRFIEISRSVGGDAVEWQEDQDINTLIRSLYPDAANIASNLPQIKLATINPDDIDDPRELNGTDLAVIQGEIGVAENGSVWIPQNVSQKVVYFIAENLVILLDKIHIVHTMHEAYQRIRMNDNGFGVFISGPSKTADIEQALVIGAHGAKSVVVILR